MEMIEIGKANLVGKTVQFCSYDSKDTWFFENERLNLTLGGHYVITEQCNDSALLCVNGDHGEQVVLYSEQIHVVG